MNQGFKDLNVWKKCRELRMTISELLDHLSVALDEGYISDSKVKQIENDISECLKMVNGYINYLKKMKTDS